LDVVGLDHIYLAVRDFAVSESFYDRVMGALGFKKGDMPVAGEAHAHYFHRALQISIRPARPGSSPHDPYTAGLHHVCLQVRTRGDVDEVCGKLRELGVAATAPRAYPEYNPEYYATFFEDPDGIRLEVVARNSHRDVIADRWSELEGFLNPVRRLLERDGGD